MKTIRGIESKIVRRVAIVILAGPAIMVVAIIGAYTTACSFATRRI